MFGFLIVCVLFIRCNYLGQTLLPRGVENLNQLSLLSLLFILCMSWNIFVKLQASRTNDIRYVFLRKFGRNLLVPWSFPFKIHLTLLLLFEVNPACWLPCYPNSLKMQFKNDLLRVTETGSTCSTSVVLLCSLFVFSLYMINVSMSWKFNPVTF